MSFKISSKSWCLKKIAAHIFIYVFFFSVITGSTDGIGKSYATELARRGINLILVSRNLEKLSKTQKEIG